MNYLSKSRHRSVYQKIVIYLVIVFLFGALILHFLGGIIVSATAPLWRGENMFTRSLGGVTEYFSFKRNLIAENENLRTRVGSLEAELASRSTLTLEESALLLRFGRGELPEGTLAGVLARPPKTPYDILIIDAGSNENVYVGADVSLPEGPVLGRISEVSYTNSRVMLFTASGEKTPAIMERSGIAVEVEGMGGGSFKVSVPRETAVEVGDRILSADVHARLLGVVESVAVEPTDSFKEVLARGPANIFNLSLVTVR